jgi:hypothetical protein
MMIGMIIRGGWIGLSFALIFEQNTSGDYNWDKADL